jgi:hypothetical protein
MTIHTDAGPFTSESVNSHVESTPASVVKRDPPPVVAGEKVPAVA